MDWNTVVDGKQEWDKDIKFGGVPQNAVVLKRPENIFQGLAPYFFGSILLCFLTAEHKHPLGPVLLPRKHPYSREQEK